MKNTVVNYVDGGVEDTAEKLAKLYPDARSNRWGMLDSEEERVLTWLGAEEGVKVVDAYTVATGESGREPGNITTKMKLDDLLDIDSLGTDQIFWLIGLNNGQTAIFPVRGNGLSSRMLEGLRE